MPYDSDDLEQVECAIMKLAKGERLVTVDLGGRQESYGIVRLDELIKLRDTIREEINATLSGESRRPRVYRARHSKGL